MKNKLTLRDYIEKSMELDKLRLATYKTAIRNSNIEGTLKCRTSHDRKSMRYYYIQKGSKNEVYLGRKRTRAIKALQKRRIAEEMVKILENNIYIKEMFCEAYLDSSEQAVISKLPKSYNPLLLLSGEREAKLAYRKPGTSNAKATKKTIIQSENPYRREDLVLITSFGLYVRTKGELEIAELLYSLGIEFYYEKKLELWNEDFGLEIYYPDFTIVLPDGDCVYWEHKGLLGKENYVQRDIRKEIVYNLNGIYQPHNYMVTAEGPNNEFDMEGITNLVNGWLMPLLAA